MRQKTARQLLDGWEAFRVQPMPVRAAALAALLTGRPLREVMRWGVARRDRALFDFRAQHFGDRVEAVTSCPSCAEPLEMQLALAQITPPRPPAATSGAGPLRIGRSRVRWREPNSEDLLAVAALRDVDEARGALISRCIHTDNPRLRERAAARLAARAGDDVQLNLTCPGCQHAWRAPFDIAAFVWRELEDWAQRTLHEIHVIAGAYGWSEDDILRLTATRRHTYIEMI